MYKANPKISIPISLLSYTDYRNGAPQYNFTEYYWQLMVARLTFVLVFVVVVSAVAHVIRWMIPDVSTSLARRLHLHDLLLEKIVREADEKGYKSVAEAIGKRNPASRIPVNVKN